MPPSSFNANERKLLKLQFSKQDRNHDGRLTESEFALAIEGARKVLPKLKSVTKEQIKSSYASVAGKSRTGLDINGYFRVGPHGC